VQRVKAVQSVIKVRVISCFNTCLTLEERLSKCNFVKW